MSWKQRLKELWNGKTCWDCCIKGNCLYYQVNKDEDVRCAWCARKVEDDWVWIVINTWLAILLFVLAVGLAVYYYITEVRV